MAVNQSQIQSSDARYRNQVDADPQSRFVQKARIDRGSRERSLSTRPSEDGRRGRTTSRLYRGPQEVEDSGDTVSQREQILNQRYYPDSSQSITEPTSTSSNPTKKKIHTSLFARARGITFGIITLSWLVPFYFIWQLPISIVGAIMLGLSLQVENYYLLSAIDTSARTFGSLFGYEYFDLVGFGVLATITVAGFGVITACIAGFTAILWGLRPLSGNAAGTKTTTFIIGVVGACIPFINMFPWIVFWVLVMMRYPK